MCGSEVRPQRENEGTTVVEQLSRVAEDLSSSSEGRDVYSSGSKSLELVARVPTGRTRLTGTFESPGDSNRSGRPTSIGTTKLKVDSPSFSVRSSGPP